MVPLDYNLRLKGTLNVQMFPISPLTPCNSMGNLWRKECGKVVLSSPFQTRGNFFSWRIQCVTRMTFKTVYSGTIVRASTSSGPLRQRARPSLWHLGEPHPVLWTTSLTPYKAPTDAYLATPLPQPLPRLSGPRSSRSYSQNTFPPLFSCSVMLICHLRESSKETLRVAISIQTMDCYWLSIEKMTDRCYFYLFWPYQEYALGSGKLASRFPTSIRYQVNERKNLAFPHKIFSSTST
jgi:hypothetical protein